MVKRAQQNKLRYILFELMNHLPYSIFGVISAIAAMGFFSFIIKNIGTGRILPFASNDLFHIFHPSHILFSAVTTTAIFWKHDNRSVVKAAVIGFVGSVGICGISDIFIPFLGGWVLGYNMQAHVCIIEHPQLIIPFSIIGVCAGFVLVRASKRSTQYTHLIHVFLSSSASLLYLISFGLFDWMHIILGVFFITVIAVMLPCCLSDIIFPLACTHQFCDHKRVETKIFM